MRSEDVSMSDRTKLPIRKPEGGLRHWDPAGTVHRSLRRTRSFIGIQLPHARVSDGESHEPRPRSLKNERDRA